MAYKQGEKLPESSGIAGEWVDDYLFLFARVSDEKIATFVDEDGKRCLGFNLVYLAAGLETDAIGIMKANRLGLLHITSVDEPPQPGADASRMYTIAIDDGNATECRVNVAAMRGHA